MSRPTRASEAGRAYLDLQNRASAERRGTQQFLTLYVVERWLARLSASPHADKFVIKGGMLLAAYGARRPTADLDALARSIANDQDAVVGLVSDIAQLNLNDGVEYQTETATSRIIRDQATYSGVRIGMDCAIATAAVKFRLDVNFGDPITPPPRCVTLPALRPGMEPVRVLGYQSRPYLPRRSPRPSLLAQPIPASVTTLISTRSPAANPSPSARLAKRCSRPQRTGAHRFTGSLTRSATSPASAAGPSRLTARAWVTPLRTFPATSPP